jgi:hypothetical protein
MMKNLLKSFSALAAVAMLLASAQLVNAGTILKLSLGDTGPDVEYSGGAGGVFSTFNDTDPTTTGEQNTAIDFVGDLAPFFADVLTPIASYSLNGVTAAGLASVVNGQVGQLFAGGDFQLYDPANTLLLDVDLTSSALSGFVGSTAGAEFSINNGIVVGGTLAPYLDATSISFSIALTGINDPAGMTITPVGLPIIMPGLTIQPATVNAFTADADKLVAADVIIPEPGTVLLLGLGGLACVSMIRRRTA